MPPIGPDDPALHPGQVGQASPSLFTALVDDAAMFPPGNAPLEQAVRDHRGHRTAWYADLVGPLLVPAARVPDMLDYVAGQGFSEPLVVGVVSPGGLDPARAALAATRNRSEVTVVAVELPLAADDEVAPAWAGLADASTSNGPRAVWWELDREGPLREQLGRLAGAARTAGPGGAKLRTGGPDPSAFPAESELAAFLRHAIDRDLTFKLTAGLHHALRRTDDTPRPVPLEQHGVLNILCAVKAALNGAEEDELTEVLSERDAAPLVGRTHGMSEADASVIRAFWSSFGCCGVTDPIGELAELGLLQRDPTTATSR
jgi:hypothetical protein